jgi:hypothetical protein
MHKKRLSKELAELAANNTSLGAVLKYLIRTYLTNVDGLSAETEGDDEENKNKRMLRKVQVHFHEDKTVSFPKEKQVLYSQISRKLNDYTNAMKGL